MLIAALFAAALAKEPPNAKCPPGAICSFTPDYNTKIDARQNIPWPEPKAEVRSATIACRDVSGSTFSFGSGDRGYGNIVMGGDAEAGDTHRLVIGPYTFIGTWTCQAVR